MGRWWLPVLLLLVACGPQVPVTSVTPTSGAAGESGEALHSPLATPDDVPNTEAPGARQPDSSSSSIQPTPEASGTPLSWPIEVVLLYAIAEKVCPYPKDPDQIDFYRRYFYTDSPPFRFDCTPAEGHIVTVAVRRFADASTALAEFDADRPPGPVSESDFFRAADWQEQYPSFPGGREEIRVRLMQTGVWVVSIRSFDDTHFLIAPDPRQVSQDVFDAIVSLGEVP